MLGFFPTHQFFPNPSQPQYLSLRHEPPQQVTDFFHTFCKLKNLFPEKENTLEIEIRAGEYFLDQSSKYLSLENFLILSRRYDFCALGNERLANCHPKDKEIFEHGKKHGLDWMLNRKAKFKPGVSEKFFFSRLDFFTSSSEIKELPGQFSIDIIMPKPHNGRFSVDLMSDDFGCQTTEKMCKSSMDIAHLGLVYRISGAIEHSKEVKIEELLNLIRSCFNKKPMVRVKVRRRFQFRFYEFDLTQVYQMEHFKDEISEEQKASNTFIDNMKLFVEKLANKQIDSQTARMTILQQCIQIGKPKYEIEAEIVETNYFMDRYNLIWQKPSKEDSRTLMDRYASFHSKIAELLNNSELLFRSSQDDDSNIINNELHLSEYKRRLWGLLKQDCILPLPCIGAYLNKMMVRERKQKEKHDLQGRGEAQNGKKIVPEEEGIKSN